MQNVVQGTSKCAPVVLSPDAGFRPINVFLQSTQIGGHIFYRLSGSIPAKLPEHNGDNAISPTVRMGTNNGWVSVNNLWLTAICYKAGLLDSDVSTGEYDVPG